MFLCSCNRFFLSSPEKSFPFSEHRPYCQLCSLHRSFKFCRSALLHCNLCPSSKFTLFTIKVVCMCHSQSIWVAMSAPCPFRNFITLGKLRLRSYMLALVLDMLVLMVCVRSVHKVSAPSLAPQLLGGLHFVATVSGSDADR